MIDINIPAGTDKRLADCLRGTTRQVNEELELLRAKLGKLRAAASEGEYGGDYEVTPSFAAQTLETRAKTMTDDLTIRAIPVSRTTNPAGGKTIYIGEV